MKIGVIGPNGQLGSELVRQGCVPIEGRFYSRIFPLEREIDKGKFDAIINCAAYTDVDGAETFGKRAVDINALGVSELTEIYAGYLVQMSTDYIFDGLGGPYSVNAPPNPISIYGWSKLGGELIVRRHKGPWLIIRTTILFSENQNNFVCKVIKQLEKGKTVTLYQPDLLGTPTYVPKLAKEIIRVIMQGYMGVAHIVGREKMTRLQFAQLIAHIFGFNPDDIQTSDEIPAGAPRPPRAGLISDHSGYRPIISHSAVDGLYELARRYEKGEIWKR